MANQVPRQHLKSWLADNPHRRAVADANGEPAQLSQRHYVALITLIMCARVTTAPSCSGFTRSPIGRIIGHTRPPRVMSTPSLAACTNARGGRW